MAIYVCCNINIVQRYNEKSFIQIILQVFLWVKAGFDLNAKTQRRKEYHEPVGLRGEMVTTFAWLCTFSYIELTLNEQIIILNF